MKKRYILKFWLVDSAGLADSTYTEVVFDDPTMALRCVGELTAAEVSNLAVHLMKEAVYDDGKVDQVSLFHKEPSL